MTSAHPSDRAPRHGAPRVVVGVDGSSESFRALAWAATEAQLRHAVLEVVHGEFARQEVLEAVAPSLLADELTILERAVKRARALQPDLVVEGRLCEPPAADALIEASHGAEMLVVGSRGLTGLREMALGSVSTACVHHAHCPVVVVRPADLPTGAG